MSKNINVVVGILLRPQADSTQILIARRPDNSVLGGFWEFPGGKIESDETPAQCVEREFTEELGIEVAAGQALDVIEYQYPHGLVHLHPFLCRWTTGRPSNLQVAEHRWVTADQLADFSFPPANADLIDKLPTIVAALQTSGEPS